MIPICLREKALVQAKDNTKVHWTIIQIVLSLREARLGARQTESAGASQAHPSVTH